MPGPATGAGTTMNRTCHVNRAEDGMQEYFVYENWTRDGVRVHESGCPDCAEGSGHPGDSQRGKWHGPYRDRSWALKFAAALRHSDTKSCDHCMH